MYNEEAKAEFIKDYMRSRVVAATSLSGFFNKITPIIDDKKVGFVINSSKIYIDLDDLDGCEYKNTSLCINGKLMSFIITIK